MLLLLSLTALPVTAAVSGRISNIKSRGVFVGTNGTDEVVLDSADLRYLAGQLDTLETMVNALSMNTGGNIVYDYHHHAKGDGTLSQSTLYTTANPGGCYRSAGHTHDKTGDCSYTWSPNTYHVHSGSPTSGGGCYTHAVHGTVTCTVYESGCFNSYTGDDGLEHCQYTVRHTNCGYGERVLDHSPHTSDNHRGARSWQQQCETSTITGYTATCGNRPLNAGSQKVYTCGSPVNTWTVGCGWREGEIQSASIQFSPSN